MIKRKIYMSLVMAFLLLITALIPLTVASAASDYTKEEIEFARLIQMEGGVDTESRQAIASVVINRLNNPSWKDNSITEVIHHKGQFSVVSSGKFKTLSPKAENLSVAREAINSGAFIRGIEFFKSSSSSKGSVKEGLYYWGSHPYYKTIRGNHFYFRNKSAYDTWVQSGGSSTVSATLSTIGHTVVKRDTLSRLALKYGTTVTIIKKLNPTLNGSMLVLGTEVRVPSKRTLTVSGSSARQFITVKKGDTLLKIARRHHTSVDRIKNTNRLKGSMILIGQKLIIS